MKKRKEVEHSGGAFTNEDGEFTDYIIMGGGQQTKADVGTIYILVAEALQVMEEIQRPPYPADDSYSEKEIKALVARFNEENFFGEERLREIAQQLYIAFTGERPWEKKSKKK